MGEAVLEDAADSMSLACNNVGKREGASFAQLLLEACDSVGLASGDSITLELFPNADGVNDREPAEVIRRCVEVFVGVDVLVDVDVLLDRGCEDSDLKLEGRFESGGMEAVLSKLAGEDEASVRYGVSVDRRFERTDVVERGGELVWKTEKDAEEPDGVQSSFFL